MVTLSNRRVDIVIEMVFILSESARKLYPVLMLNWSISLTFFVPVPVVSA